MPTQRLQTSRSSWVSGRSTRNFSLIRCILLSSFSSNFLLASSAEAVGKQSAEESTTSPAAPANSGRASDGTGTATYPSVTALPCGSGSVRTPGRAPVALTVSVPVGLRARLPPPLGDCGGGFLPEPSRRTSAHVWPMSGAVAPCAASRRQRVRTPWHDR